MLPYFLFVFLQILIGVPRLQQRIDILKVLTRSTPLHNDVDLSLLAETTPGYVGADLESLVQQAHYTAVTELLSQSDHHGGNQVINKNIVLLVSESQIGI